MKVKIKNLQVTSDCVNIDIKDSEIDVSEKEINLFISKVCKEGVINYHRDKKFLTYIDSPKAIIDAGDLVEILPSENCVVNTDTIRYDESIDGKKAIVISTMPPVNRVLVEISGTPVQILVHSHWLKYIGPNGSKNNP